MNKRVTGFFICLVVLLWGTTTMFPTTLLSAEGSGVVIRRFQAGGAGSGTTAQEYIELFNNTDTDIEVTNWCVLYQGLSNLTPITVACLTSPDNNTKLLLYARTSVLFMSSALETLIKQTDSAFQADKVFETTVNLAASNGSLKVADQSGTIIDALGWGTIVGEGVSMPGNIPGGKVLQRIATDSETVKDTNDNSLDFELVNAPGTYEKAGLYEQIEQTPPREETETPPETEPTIDCSITNVFINEVVSNPAGSDTDGGEFVELYNDNSQPLSLKGCLLTTDKISNFALPDISIEAYGYYAIGLVDKLLNAGGTVTFITATTEESISYPELGDNAAWSLVENVWQLTEPTPETANVPLISLEEQCQADGLIMTEILANPLGSDAAGGEFVELYNASLQPVSLLGCFISTDKDDSIELPGVVLEPGQYHAIALADKLLNGGGNVVLALGQNDETITYPELSDDEAWALFDTVWDITNIPTPGAVNQPSQTQAQIAGATTTDNTCPAGKFRNPETNRCKNITSTASSLVPCDPGQERNPTTNRCRKVAGTASSLTACQPGYERNPDTNRCRKLTSQSVPEYSAILTGEGETPLHPAILLSLSTLLIGYGLYEYRHALMNKLNRLRTRFIKSPS